MSSRDKITSYAETRELEFHTVHGMFVMMKDSFMKLFHSLMPLSYS